MSQFNLIDYLNKLRNGRLIFLKSNNVQAQSFTELYKHAKSYMPNLTIDFISFEDSKKITSESIESGKMETMIILQHPSLEIFNRLGGQCWILGACLFDESLRDKNFMLEKKKNLFSNFLAKQHVVIDGTEQKEMTQIAVLSGAIVEKEPTEHTILITDSVLSRTYRSAFDLNNAIFHYDLLFTVWSSVVNFLSDDAVKEKVYESSLLQMFAGVKVKICCEDDELKELISLSINDNGGDCDEKEPNVIVSDEAASLPLASSKNIVDLKWIYDCVSNKEFRDFEGYRIISKQKKTPQEEDDKKFFSRLSMIHRPNSPSKDGAFCAEGFVTPVTTRDANKPYKCSFDGCDRAFKFLDSLHAHETKAHNAPSYVYVCSCGVICITRFYLSNHRTLWGDKSLMEDLKIKFPDMLDGASKARDSYVFEHSSHVTFFTSSPKEYLHPITNDVKWIADFVKMNIEILAHNREQVLLLLKGRRNCGVEDKFVDLEYPVPANISVNLIESDEEEGNTM